MLPVKSREVYNLYVSCYPDNYVMRYTYYHQSVGEISQSFLNLWHLLHSGYKRHKLTKSLKYFPEERSYSNQTFWGGSNPNPGTFHNWHYAHSMHIAQLTLYTLYAHCTPDIMHTLCTLHNWHYACALYVHCTTDIMHIHSMHIAQPTLCTL